MFSSPTRWESPKWKRRSVAMSVFGANMVILLWCHQLYQVDANNQSQAAVAASAPALEGDASTLSQSWENVLVDGPIALVETRDQILFFAMLLLAFELLDFLTRNSGIVWNSKQIPVRGKHLDDLTTKDLIFIGISKAGTAPFVYWYLRFCYSEAQSDCIDWKLSEINPINTVLGLVALFVVYDFFYTALHGILHIKSIYGWIHKHHHIQKAPSRANVDAVNVHPIEFVLGEYNHLWSLYLVTRVMSIHIITSFAFLAIGGFLAGINHTRFDVVIPCLGWNIYDSKAHDVHHRIPQSNYGQYTMLWDHIFGTYRAYNPNDRINPESQLDPRTGKSFAQGVERNKSL